MLLLAQMQEAGRGLGMRSEELESMDLWDELEAFSPVVLLGQRQVGLVNQEKDKALNFKLRQTTGYIYFLVPVTCPKLLGPLHLTRPNIGTLTLQVYWPGVRLTRSWFSEVAIPSFMLFLKK